MKRLLFLSLCTTYVAFCVTNTHRYDTCGEGFSGDTKVKIDHSYRKIKDIIPGQLVSAYNMHNHVDIQRTVVKVYKRHVSKYIRIVFDDAELSTAVNQRLYIHKINKWVTARELKNSEELQKCFSPHIVSVEKINEKLDVYTLLVDKDHNFYVTDQTILAHNFIPLTIGVTVCLETGAVTVAWSVGAAVVSWLGYKLFQKPSRNVHCIPTANTVQPNPNDDDPEKKKSKRDEARANHRPPTNKEARKQAKKLGYTETKDHSFGSTRGRPVFKKGNKYISPDADGHKGGYWKMINSGQRTTWNKELTQLIGK